MVSRPSKNVVQIGSFPQIEKKTFETTTWFRKFNAKSNGKWFFWGIPWVWPKVCQGKTYMKPPHRFVCWNRQIDEEKHIFQKKSTAVGGFSPPTIQPNNKNDGTLWFLNVSYGFMVFLMVFLMVVLMVSYLVSTFFLVFLMVLGCMNERDFGLRFLEKLSKQQQTISFISQSFFGGLGG